MDIADKLTWESIYAWAERADETQPLGYSCSCYMSPIACYIRETTHRIPYVIRFGCTHSSPKAFMKDLTYTPFPLWLQNIEEKVDQIKPKHQPISKQTFLAILAECKPAPRYSDVPPS